MNRAVEIIKSFEGLRLEAYRDNADVWTIGYGHTNGVVSGDKITNEQADAFMQKDMAWVLKSLDATVHVPLTENQHAATASLIFNIGEGAWRTSTALRRLNALNYVGAADAMTWFYKSRRHGVLTRDPGLVNRRKAEQVLFLTGDDA